MPASAATEANNGLRTLGRIGFFASRARIVAHRETPGNPSSHRGPKKPASGACETTHLRLDGRYRVCL